MKQTQKKEKLRFAVVLATAIRDQRKALKLTQIELGRFAGCGVDFIYDLENGKSTIRLDKLMDVLLVLGLQLTLETGKQGLKASPSERHSISNE